MMHLQAVLVVCEGACHLVLSTQVYAFPQDVKQFVAWGLRARDTITQ